MAAATESRTGKDILFLQPEGYFVDAPIEKGVAVLPANTLVGLDDDDGIWKRATSAGTYNLVGILTEELDTSDDSADGDTTARVAIRKVIKLVGSGLSSTDVGKMAYVSDNQTITLTQGEGNEQEKEIAGGAAGNLTVSGIGADDKLVSVLVFDPGAEEDFEDLTDEFSITADDTINNAGGTSTSGKEVTVRWQSRAGAFIGPVVGVPSATEAHVLVEGYSPSRV